MFRITQQRFNLIMILIDTFVVASTCSPFNKRVWMTPTCPFRAAMWILLAPLYNLTSPTVVYNRFLINLITRLKIFVTLLGMWSGTPFFSNIRAVSGCPWSEATCNKVLPSLVRSKQDARNFSVRISTTAVRPLSAARRTGVRSVRNFWVKIRWPLT